MDMQATLEVTVNYFFQEETHMSTSLLYHAFGIRGYRYTRTDYCEGDVVFTVEQRMPRSEEHTSELQSHLNLVCRLLLEKKNIDSKSVYARHTAIKTTAS